MVRHVLCITAVCKSLALSVTVFYSILFYSIATQKMTGHIFIQMFEFYTVIMMTISIPIPISIPITIPISIPIPLSITAGNNITCY